MKLPNVKKILREDVKDAPDWVNVIIGTFNSFAEAVYLTLNKNVDEVNLVSQIKELNVETPSTYPSMLPIKFLSTLKIRGTGLVVLQAYDKQTYAPVVGGNLAWLDNNGQIEITEITGLQASKSYVIRVRLT